MEAAFGYLIDCLVNFISDIPSILIVLLIISIWKSLTTGSGTLKIDHSNPEKDVYRFEIDDLEQINSKKRVILKIDHKADLSQK